MSNKELGDFLRTFTTKEDELRKRARAAAVDLEHPKWREWQKWIGDPVRYLHELRTEVEKHEARAKRP